MRLLADESLERRIIVRRREAGHDVLAVAEDRPGSLDEDVLNSSLESPRILITADKDFARLAFFERRGAIGLVLLRMPRATVAAKGARLLQVLDESPGALAGAMTVVEDGGVRRRRLPT